MRAQTSSSRPSHSLQALAGDLLLASDLVQAAKATGIRPDEWQANFLRSTSDRILLNCCRQSGKSTIAALAAVHTLLYEPQSLVLLLSPSLRQSQELFRKLLGFYAALDRPVPSEAESALRLELGNGSRAISLPGTEGTVRGYSNVRLMVVDEAARVEDSLFHATRPMLAVSHGRLVCMSTPWGRRGFFYEAWHSRAQWERYRVTAAQCPRISRDFLAEEKVSMGPYWYRQEYETEFLEAETSVFSADQIDASFDPELQPFGFLGPEWI